jgi:hypothetical protein
VPAEIAPSQERIVAGARRAVLAPTREQREREIPDDDDGEAIHSLPPSNDPQAGAAAMETWSAPRRATASPDPGRTSARAPADKRP